MDPKKDPTHFYFQCIDSESLLLLESKLFTTEGNIPRSSWFYYTFGGGMKRPTPLGEHPVTKFPIYYVPIPYLVCLELIQLIILPELRETSLQVLPLSLEDKYSRAVWFEYVKYYKLEPDLHLKRKAEEELEHKKKKKLATAEAKLRDLEELPRFQYIRRVAEALADEIKLKHPRWNEFTTGKLSSLRCIFINTFQTYPVSDDGDLTYKLHVPGDPAIEPVNIAFEIGIALQESYDSFVYNMKEPNQRYFRYCLLRVFEFKYPMNTQLVSTRDTKAKKRIQTAHWPTTKSDVTPGDHDVFALELNHLVVGDTPEDIRLSYLSK